MKKRLIANLVLFTAVPALAQDLPARTWTDALTLSYLSTSGNSSGQTMSFANDYTKTWNLMSLTAKGKMVRASSTLVAFSAYGASLEDAVIYRVKTKSVTAENFFLSTRFDYRLRANNTWYWYSEASWEQNLPIGLDSRTSLKAGMGHLFLNSEKSSWRVDLGVGATREEPSNPPVGYHRDFGTFNITSNLKHRFNENVNYNADLTCTYRLEDTSDGMYVLKQSVKVAMTKRTSLSVGFDMNYRTRPALLSVRVFTENDPPEPLGNILVPAKKLDTVATTSLVFVF